MPRTRRCWASWNYRIDANGAPTTHYWMNSLQGVPEKVNYFVSLNCEDRIPPERVLKRIRYEHPLFDLGAVRAQEGSARAQPPIARADDVFRRRVVQVWLSRGRARFRTGLRAGHYGGGTVGLKSCLYECRVMHRRILPKAHKFEYRIFMFSLYLDEIEKPGKIRERIWP